MSRGLDVLVATPGRLLDLIDQRALSLRELEILVLDEADQMLDLGFIHALKRIVSLVPAKRQTLFFSATMPKAIKELADRYLTNPAEVAVTPVAKTADRVEQRVVHGQPAGKDRAADHVPPDRSRSSARWSSAAPSMAPTRSSACSIAAGIAANAIHGNKSQGQRERALAEFRSGQTPVLIATDIAARGIDIPGVSHVVNYDLPEVPEQYVHRIGRTARAGAEGQAIAFCAHDERGTSARYRAADPPEDRRCCRCRRTSSQTAEALKRAQAGPEEDEEQPRRFSHGFKSDRRADGQRREHRNQRSEPSPRSGPARHQPKRTGQQPQRHPHRADGHAAHRPEGGRPKGPFRGRRGGRPGGPRRAQG